MRHFDVLRRRYLFAVTIAVALALAAQATLVVMWLGEGVLGQRLLGVLLAVLPALVVLALGAAFLALLSRARASEDELALMSTSDPMTGVLNRRAFAGLAAQEFTRTRRYDRPLSVLSIGVDSVDDIVEAHGSEAGELLLQALTSAWQNALRTTDAIGRLDEDHFAVLLPETNGARARELAQRVRSASQNLALDFLRPHERVSVSIGVASVDTGDSGIEHALVRADQALRESRRTGRDDAEIAPNASVPS